MNFSDFILNEKKKDEIKDVNGLRLWKNLWDSIYEIDPMYAQDLVLQFKLDSKQLDNPNLVDDNKRVQLITILNTHLIAKNPGVDYGLGMDIK